MGTGALHAPALLVQCCWLLTQSHPHTPPAPALQIAEIERVIGCGQVEQLIEQAKGELVLIPEYASWKAWEAKPASPEDEDFAVSAPACLSLTDC